MKRLLLAIFLATMVALAGCAGGLSGDGASGDGTPTGADGDGAVTDGETGTVDFYVSDQPAAIEDFQHLNVTITEIGFQKAGGGDDGEGAEDDDAQGEDDATETATPGEETGTPGDDDGADEEADGEGTATETPEDEEDAEDETDEPDETEEEAEDEDDSDEAEEGADGEDDGEGDDGGESGEWITVNVDNRTVDLTQLRGDNASLIGSMDLPAGNYTKVFVHVGEVEGTLTDGTDVNVKLPSEKLQLTKGFELAPNESVSFVYDISVVKAGNSGKYILKPVISESGADQPFNDVDEEDEERDDDAEGDDAADADDADEAEEADEADDEDTADDPAEENGGDGAGDGGAGDGGPGNDGGPDEPTPTETAS